MTTHETELIVASVHDKHPAGFRNRGGYRFSTIPSVAEVTPEQKALIKADRYITIHRRLSMKWFKAFGLEHTEENEKMYKDEDPKNWKKTANLAEVKLPEGVDSQASGNAPQAGKESQGGGTTELSMDNTKAEMVKALEKLGLVAGTDFEPEAKKEILLATYKEKSAAQASTKA